MKTLIIVIIISFFGLMSNAQVVELEFEKEFVSFSYDGNTEFYQNDCVSPQVNVNISFEKIDLPLHISPCIEYQNQNLLEEILEKSEKIKFKNNDDESYSHLIK